MLNTYVNSVRLFEAMRSCFPLPNGDYGLKLNTASGKCNYLLLMIGIV